MKSGSYVDTREEHAGKICAEQEKVKEGMIEGFWASHGRKLELLGSESVGINVEPKADTKAKAKVECGLDPTNHFRPGYPDAKNQAWQSWEQERSGHHRSRNYEAAVNLRLLI